MYFDKIYLFTEFWLEWLLLLFKLFINNDIRALGLSQYVATSVTEVSDVHVHFTEAILMLILYQQHSPTDYLLVMIIVNDIDITGLSHTDDYRVDISYATCRMKNFLFIFEKEAF